MCPDNTLSQRLKQTFSPAIRLWMVRELVPENRYLEVVKDFLELSDGVYDSKNIQEREQLQALLSEWIRTEQWQYFVPAIEIILQVAHQESRQAALKTLCKSWPEHLTLSKEGFIQYRDRPLLHCLSQAPDTQKEESATTATPTEAESRKEMFQRIRQKRLLLLKKWESL